MSVLSVQCARLRSWAMQFDERADIDALAPLLASDLREAADTIESLRDRLQADVLGSGTCYSTTDDSAWCFACSECGKSFPRNKLHLAHNHGEINFCPNCGAKVVER